VRDGWGQAIENRLRRSIRGGCQGEGVGERGDEPPKLNLLTLGVRPRRGTGNKRRETKVDLRGEAKSQEEHWAFRKPLKKDQSRRTQPERGTRGRVWGCCEGSTTCASVQAELYEGADEANGKGKRGPWRRQGAKIFRGEELH